MLFAVRHFFPVTSLFFRYPPHQSDVFKNRHSDPPRLKIRLAKHKPTVVPSCCLSSFFFMNLSLVPFTHTTMKRSIVGSESPTKPVSRTKPKRCLTAYNFFFQAERRRILETSTEFSGTREDFAPLSTQISERWSRATVAEKREFEMMAETDKLRYMRDLQEFHQSLDDVQAERRALAASISEKQASTLSWMDQTINPSPMKRTTGTDFPKLAPELHSIRELTTMGDQRESQGLLNQLQFYSSMPRNESLHPTDLIPSQKRARLSVSERATVEHPTSVSIASPHRAADSFWWGLVARLAGALDEESTDFLISLFSDV
jgi:HMG (high mobility group) box